MSFVILACSDIRAQKVNLEFPFNSPPPSIQTLRSVFEQTFRAEEEAMKVAMGVTDIRACEPFTINRLQRYDDDTQTWTEITAVSQLQSYDQLYIFRKNSTKADISPQRELPPPRRSSFFTAAMMEPSHSPLKAIRPSSASYDANGVYGGLPDTSAMESSASRPQQPLRSSQFLPSGSQVQGSSSPYRPSAGADPLLEAQPPAGGNGYYRERTTPERVEYLFRIGDSRRQGYLNLKAFESLFRASDIRFPGEVVQDLHEHFARQTNGEMVMTFDGFQVYAANFPVAINVAYQRLTNQEKEDALRNAQQDNARALDQAQRQVQDLEARLAAAKRNLSNEDQKRGRLQADLEELHRQRDPEYCRDEQKVLDKEVSVFKYREKLSHEERDYERLAMERRRRAIQQQGRLSAAAEAHGSVNDFGGYDASRYGPRD